MSRFPVGLQLRSLRMPIKTALGIASHLKVDGIEIDARGELRPSQLTQTGIRQLRKRLEDLQLRVCAVNFQTRRGYDVVDDLERRIEATKKAMSFAFALGANVVTNDVGRIAEDESDDSFATLQQALTDIGRHGQKCGAFLAATTGSQDPAALRKLIDSLPDGSLFIDLDPGGLVVNGHSAAEALPVFGRDIIHVRARDGVRDLARGRGLEVSLGRGTVDFPQLIAHLDQQGYHGYLTVDRSDIRQPSETITEFSNAVTYLRTIQQ